MPVLPNGSPFSSFLSDRRLSDQLTDHVAALVRRSYTEDPYITLQESDDDESEIDDLAFKPTDLIILAARNEDDVSHLEARPFSCGLRVQSF